MGNLWRRLVLPKRIDAWSLTSLQQRIVKTGGRLIKHARYYWLLMPRDICTGGCLVRCFDGSMRWRAGSTPIAVAKSGVEEGRSRV